LIIASERKGFYTFHQESEPYKLKRWEGWVYLPIGACQFYIGATGGKLKAAQFLNVSLDELAGIK